VAGQRLQAIGIGARVAAVEGLQFGLSGCELGLSPGVVDSSRVDSVIDSTNLPSLARAERTRVPHKNSASDHASACIKWASSPLKNLEIEALPCLEDPWLCWCVGSIVTLLVA